MLISRSFLVTTDIYSWSQWSLRQKFDMELWLSICLKLEGSELEGILPQSFGTAQSQDLVAKTREWVKPLGNKYNDTDVFFNNLNTSFSTVLGLTMELPATYSQQSTKSQDEDFC